MRVGVVIPTLDEAARLGQRLFEVRERLHNLTAVVVADGGSRDATVAIARSDPGVRVISAPRGRASQMNAGASCLGETETDVDVLLFLHADVALPFDAGRWIERALANPKVVAGAFRTWTIADGARTWWSPLLHLADLRSRYSGLPYGDQAVFVRANAFEDVGGFPEQALLEDLELARRLRRTGRIEIVPASVRVSGRRFLARPLLFTLAVNTFPLLYRAGVSPEFLRRFYADVR